MLVRLASPDDADAIAAIYAHHVLHGTASFDEIPPTPAFWREKIETVLARDWPFLVAVSDDELLGYCYATQFRDRPAYQFTCENSIYVHPDHLGEGVGRTLLAQLIAAAKAAGFREMIAVIGGAEPASVGLHGAAGFVERGRMKSVGFKFGKWLDSVYMQLSLQDMQITA
jgi:phosphinothricin acetyltransferase